MKIGIDISQIIYETGVSWYTKNLVENLLKLSTSDEFTLFGGSLRQTEKLKLLTKSFKGNFTTKFYPFPPLLADYVWNRLHVLPIEGLIGKVDVFHSSDWTQPPTKAYKVTTIHDLVPIIFPEDTPPGVVAVHKRRLAWVKKEVDKIIAVSESTKSDIIERLGIPEEKITVIYEAPDPIYTKRTKVEIDKVKAKYSISEDYLLSVGSGKRKNLGRTYEAFLGVRRQKPNLKLVIACHGELNLQKGMIQAKSPTGDELACLYSGAQCLAYASLYEGFGLPILEAFSCLCPVVTSNASSMPEVAGNAAIIVDPHSAKSIEEGMLEAIRTRESLIVRGKKRVREFSWEKTARETLEIYHEAI